MIARRTWMALGLGLLALPALAQQPQRSQPAAQDGGGVVMRQPLNHPPQVSLYTPTNGQEFATGATVSLQGTASDQDAGDAISSVDFLVDGVVVATFPGQMGGYTYQHQWTATTAGSHTIQIQATDTWDLGPNVTLSPARTISVIATNVPPTVSLTAPANGATYVPGAGVSMTATASDSDGTVTIVYFLVDGAMVGWDSSSPYAYTWTGTAGSHTVQAQAKDNRGDITTTLPITISGNTLPSVSLTAPANGASYTTGATVTMTATASDSDGTINKVEFYLDGSLYATDTSSPFAQTWPAAVGSHTIKAKSYDNAGGVSAFSNQASITVSTPPNVPPTVSLTAPANGARLNPNTSLTISANASDSDGTIKRVEFLVDGAQVGQDASTPYAYVWTVTPTPGNHTVQARAVDNQNATATSSVTVVVNTSPTTSLTSPSIGTGYAVGATASFAATAGDSDGTIAKVEFFVDGAKVGEDASTPYAGSWTVTSGMHVVESRAVDNDGGYQMSTPVTIYGTTPPTVSLTAPFYNTLYDTGAAVAMAATASDADGTINRVEFLVDGIQVGQDASSPYAYTWTAATGNHGMQARAVDNRGVATTTTSITIHVDTLPVVTLTAPASGASYIVGDTVAMAATASDADGTIHHVEFWVDGAVVGQDTSSPYGYAWTATTGNHQLQARAVDDQNNATTTGTRTILVSPNDPPTASLTAPASGASYTIGATVALTATASDSDGTVTQVEFFVDGTKVGQATSSPYTYNWTATAGDHSVYAKATDNHDASTSTSPTITIHGVPPVPTLSLPSTNTTGSYTASWTTSTGATHYELSEQFNSGSWSSTQDTSATSWNASGKANGSYTYKVRACTGSAGNTSNCSSYSSTKTITVSTTVSPPAVPTLTVPSTSSTGSYTASWTTSSGATHYDLSEKIGSGSWVSIQNTSSTSRAISGKTTGSYSYRVRACTGDPSDMTNCSSDSSTKTITVTIASPPVSITRTYHYNSNQELCSVEEPETGVTLMGYDAAGNLTWSASGLPSGTACSSTGNTTAINARKAVRTYDTRNRVSTLEFPDDNGNQSWTYTPDGLPDTVTTYNDAGASSVVNSYTYNHRRLLTGESQISGGNTWTVGYGYDGNGALSTLVYPASLTVDYAPNALGQPTQAGSYATNVTYYPNGAIKQFTYGNGIVHTLTQNTRGLPDRSRDADGSTSIHDDSYDYDAVGNVLAISDGVAGGRGDRDMTYDALNRLTQVVSPAVSPAVFGTATYTYDELDNLKHVHVTAGPKTRDQEYFYDTHNRLTNLIEDGESVIGLDYDVQGNLYNKNGTYYTFDYGNRLRAGGPETYRYDVQGRRIRSSSTAGVVYSLYAQSGQLLFQQDERSGKRRQYIYLGGSLVAESDLPLTGSTATVTYQHTDALGTPVAITNASRTVTERREYEPYGYQLTPTLQDGPNYTGHVADAATGLVYMQQRYMDPLIGQRFLSVDPVTAYGPGGAFNQYWYANANPYRMVDPDGRDPQSMDDPHPPIPPPTGPFTCPEKGCNPPLPPSTTQSESNQSSSDNNSKTNIIDLDKVVVYVDKHAEARSRGLCARYCRLAFEAGGVNTSGHPISAKDYGPLLLRNGAIVVPSQGYSPQKGDVVVFSGSDLHPHGHIAIFDGANWVSDFKQRNMSPYRVGTPPATIYRFNQK